MNRRRSTYIGLPKMPEFAPIDIRLITALLALTGILGGVGVVLIVLLWGNAMLPAPIPAFTPTQLETL